MKGSVTVEEFTRGMKKLGERDLRSVDQIEINRLVMKVLGVLADASSQEARRRVLSKAMRMISVR